MLGRLAVAIIAADIALAAAGGVFLAHQSVTALRTETPTPSSSSHGTTVIVRQLPSDERMELIEHEMVGLAHPTGR